MVFLFVSSTTHEVQRNIVQFLVIHFYLMKTIFLLAFLLFFLLLFESRLFVLIPLLLLYVFYIYPEYEINYCLDLDKNESPKHLLCKSFTVIKTFFCKHERTNLTQTKSSVQVVTSIKLSNLYIMQKRTIVVRSLIIEVQCLINLKLYFTSVDFSSKLYLYVLMVV